MDRAQQLRDLEEAERHVVEGEGRIAKQEQIVAELDRDGHDTTEARRLLKNFYVTQNTHVPSFEIVKFPDGKPEDPSQPPRDPNQLAKAIGIGPVRDHIGGMKYRLEVKVRGAYPKPFTWEIYKDGKPLWVERSGDSYSSESEAREAGNAALLRWRNREDQNRG